jgi:hypothetical protein
VHRPSREAGQYEHIERALNELALGTFSHRFLIGV